MLASGLKSLSPPLSSWPHAWLGADPQTYRQQWGVRRWGHSALLPSRHLLPHSSPAFLCSWFSRPAQQGRTKSKAAKGHVARSQRWLFLEKESRGSPDDPLTDTSKQHHSVTQVTLASPICPSAGPLLLSQPASSQGVILLGLLVQEGSPVRSRKSGMALA